MREGWGGRAGRHESAREAEPSGARQEEAAVSTGGWDGSVGSGVRVGRAEALAHTQHTQHVCTHYTCRKSSQ